MVIEIPERLKDANFRFVLVGDINPKTKETDRKFAFEKGWQNENNYPYDHSKLLNHIEKENNYGVIGGHGDLIIIDADTMDVKETVENNLPKTFKVMSGKRNPPGFHYYFRCKKFGGKIVLFGDKTCPDCQTINEAKNKECKKCKREFTSEDVNHLGEIQSDRTYVVGPNCIHKNGNIYQIIDDLPIVEIMPSEIRSVLKKFLVDKTDSVKQEEQQIAKESKIKLDSLRIEDVVNTIGLKKSGADYQGAHPEHGSSTGSNFHITTNKNVWHCFRCNSGGGPLSWIAVREGLIACHEAIPGALRKEIFIKAIAVAHNKYGLKSSYIGKKGKIKKTKEDKGPPPDEIADAIMLDFNFVTTRDTEDVYYYNDGVYHENANTLIKEESKKRCPYINSHKANEVIFHIKTQTYRYRSEFDTHKNFIWLENHIFDLKTMDTLDFTPELISTVKIPIMYKKDADCPVIKKFISEIVTEQDNMKLQEMIGYCLLKEYPFHKAFLLEGNGSNGKTTLLSLMIIFLGENNISSIPMQAFDQNRFAVIRLRGKLANICDDLPSNVMKYTGTFKMLTGGAKIDGEEKFKGITKLTPYAKQIYSTNQPPEVKDTSDAFYRRIEEINFPNTFEGKNKDPFLLEKLTTPDELSGLFNWAIEGLKRLLKKKKFSYELDTAARREHYMRSVNSLYAFTQDMCRQEQGATILKDDFYSYYVNYCISLNLTKKAKNVIGRELIEHAPYARSDRESKGNRRYTWRNIIIEENIDVELGDKEGKNPEKGIEDYTKSKEENREWVQSEDGSIRIEDYETKIKEDKIDELPKIWAWMLKVYQENIGISKISFITKICETNDDLDHEEVERFWILLKDLEERDQLPKIFGGDENG